MNADETLYEGAEPYVFVSYSHQDSEQVSLALDAMRKRGYRFWYDKGIPAGEAWTKSLSERLSHCAIVMPFLSPAFLESQNCLDEVRFAHGKKIIVPVWLEKLDRDAMPDELKFLFSNAQELPAYQFADADAFAARLDGESAFEHCRKLRQENSVVPQKPEVPPKPEVSAKMEVPQKPDNVQSNPNTQRKENAKRTPPKDPKK